MARLIDADNIISVCEILSEKGNDPHYWGQLISIIKGMPTIDAITVEWLEAQIRPYTGDVSDIGKSAKNGTIKGIIRKWQKEQEATPWNL